MEVCHIWASRSQDEGRAGNISFNKDVLLSYHWWSMAKFINENTVLVRNWSYSSSTSKHLNYMRSAIPDYYRQISVYEPAERYTFETDHNKNIIDFQNRIKVCFDRFKTAIKYKSMYYGSQQSIISEMKNYCKLFNLPVPKYSKYNLNKDIYQVELTRQNEKLKVLELQKEEKRQKLLEQYKGELLIAQEKWIKGEINQTSWYVKEIRNYLHFDKTYLRVKDNTIETSKGANVPLKEAEILYRMIQRQENIKGHRIGNYTVIGMNGKLKIGCHEIERDEIERIAKLLNW